ncbi:MAG: hypothetical protein WAL77_05835 [Candidatus Dormiibacterota bacterium]
MQQRGWRQSLATLGIGFAVLATTGVGVASPVRAAAAGTGSSVDGLTVSVGYAENVGDSPTPSAAFPVPWNGSPNTIFIGNTSPQSAECGSVTQCYDTGAVRLDNPGPNAVVVGNVSVAVRPGETGGQTYNLWGSFTVPVGKTVILAANPSNDDPNYDNFDSSDTPHGNCTPLPGAPTVAITIAGAVTTLTDATHVIDTGGIDSGACPAGRNESIQWRRIGATATDNAAVTLSPNTATLFGGQPVTETAAVLDGSGFALPNAQVTFKVISGPDAGQSGSGTTDTNGRASFSYVGTGQGEDVVVATVASDANPFVSNQSRVMWTDDSASGWSGADIGSPSTVGSQSFSTSTGTWTINGGGTGLGGTSDSFDLLSQTLPAGTGVTARLASQTSASTGAQAGLIIRATTDPGSPFYGAVTTPGGGLEVLDRASQGSETTLLTTTGGSPPEYLWIASSGGTFTTYTSTDGSFWQPLAGSSASPALGPTPLVGFAVASDTSASTSTATFDSTALTLSQPPAPLPIPCPSPWMCGDIGAVSAPGSALMSPGGAWTLQGDGNDINGTGDQFFFAAQTLTGNGNISAHVTSQTDTNAWAKTGVMLRASTDPGSVEYSALLTPGNGILVAYRTATGGTTSTVKVGGVVPTYLKVARAGSTYTAYTSTDGMTWTLIPGSTKTLTMPSNAFEGLAVTAHTNAVLSSVDMDNVVVNGTSGPPPPTCPSGWTCQDIGSPAVAGSATSSGGTWTIAGAGSDIHGTADQFQFDYQSLAGSGTMSAHVISQADTNSWAKAGVMIRASTDPGAIAYTLLVTPGQGIVVQDRTAQGGQDNRIDTVSGTVPAYLRVERSGTTFTAYTSADGATWTLVPGSTVTLSVSGPMLQGLAVSSHNSTALCTVTMDAVQPS